MKDKDYPLFQAEDKAPWLCSEYLDEASTAG